MADFTIPIDSSDSNFSIDVTLSGAVYRLGFYWNTRGQFWSMDISDQADNPIQSGVKIVADWELLSQFTDPALPPGLLYTVDLSGQGLDPTDTDLGSRVILVYDDGQS